MKRWMGLLTGILALVVLAWPASGRADCTTDNLGTAYTLATLDTDPVFGNSIDKSGNNKYTFHCSLILRPNDSLTMAAGSTVAMDAGRLINVYGDLIVSGSAGSPVTITSSSASPTRDIWGGILLQSGNGFSTINMNYTRLLYGKIAVQNGSPTSRALSLIIRNSYLYDATITANYLRGLTLDGTTLAETAGGSSTVVNFDGSTVTSVANNLFNTESTNCIDNVLPNSVHLLSGNSLNCGSSNRIDVDSTGTGSYTASTCVSGVSQAFISIPSSRVWGQRATYVISRDLCIAEAGRLTATTPGSSMLFGATVYLESMGDLTLAGSAGSPFYLRSVSGTTTAWMGIDAEAGTSDQISLNYISMYKAPLLIHGSGSQRANSVTIQYSTFTEAPVHITRSDSVTVNANTFVAPTGNNSFIPLEFDTGDSAAADISQLLSVIDNTFSGSATNDYEIYRVPSWYVNVLYGNVFQGSGIADVFVTDNPDTAVPITTAKVWAQSDATFHMYLVNSDLQINSGGSLLISGTNASFLFYNPFGQISLSGTGSLVIDGTTTGPIEMTNDSPTPDDDGISWFSGIHSFSTTGSNLSLDHVYFHGGDILLSGVSSSSRLAHAHFTNCLLYNSSFEINHADDIVFDGNSITPITFDPGYARYSIRGNSSVTSFMNNKFYGSLVDNDYLVNGYPGAFLPVLSGNAFTGGSVTQVYVYDDSGAARPITGSGTVTQAGTRFWVDQNLVFNGGSLNVTGPGSYYRFTTGLGISGSGSFSASGVAGNLLYFLANSGTWTGLSLTGGTDNTFGLHYVNWASAPITIGSSARMTSADLDNSTITSSAVSLLKTDNVYFDNMTLSGPSGSSPLNLNESTVRSFSTNGITASGSPAYVVNNYPPQSIGWVNNNTLSGGATATFYVQTDVSPVPCADEAQTGTQNSTTFIVGDTICVGSTGSMSFVGQNSTWTFNSNRGIYINGGSFAAAGASGQLLLLQGPSGGAWGGITDVNGSAKTFQLSYVNVRPGPISVIGGAGRLTSANISSSTLYQAPVTINNSNATTFNLNTVTSATGAAVVPLELSGTTVGSVANNSFAANGNDYQIKNIAPQYVALITGNTFTGTTNIAQILAYSATPSCIATAQTWSQAATYNILSPVCIGSTGKVTVSVLNTHFKFGSEASITGTGSFSSTPSAGNQNWLEPLSTTWGGIVLDVQAGRTVDLIRTHVSGGPIRVYDGLGAGHGRASIAYGTLSNIPAIQLTNLTRASFSRNTVTELSGATADLVNLLGSVVSSANGDSISNNSLTGSTSASYVINNLAPAYLPQVKSNTFAAGGTLADIRLYSAANPALTGTNTFSQTARYRVGSTINLSSGSLAITPVGTTWKFEPGIGITTGAGTSLTVTGTSPAPIVFTSSASTPAPGAWAGIALGSGGSLSASYLKLWYPTTGVSGSSPATFTFQNGEVDNCSSYALNVSGVPAAGRVTDNYFNGMEASASTLRIGGTGKYLRNTIVSNTLNSVDALASAQPNFGDGNSLGGNQLLHLDTSGYSFNNGSALDINARGNYWGSTVDASIQSLIYDKTDSAPLGTVNYSNYIGSTFFTALALSRSNLYMGDTLTITFTTASQPSANPTVTVAGQAATYISGPDACSPSCTYTYRYTALGTSPEAHGRNAIVLKATTTLNEQKIRISQVRITFDRDKDGLCESAYNDGNATYCIQTEGAYGSSITNPDTDADGICDGPKTVAGVCVTGEVGNYGTSPVLADTDGDGFTDYIEVFTKSCLNELQADTDGDGVVDGGTLGEDKNRNLALDATETDPCDADTDDDGHNDGATDCGGRDPNNWTSCATCVDTDTDNRYAGCDRYFTILGPDCNNTNINTWDTCATCVDIDGDSRYLLCNQYVTVLGPDCSDANARTWDTCATCLDSDTDAWWTGCNAYPDGKGPDCNDANINTWNTCATCLDSDSDTWYTGCNQYATVNGPDCSDTDTNNWTLCGTCGDSDEDTWYTGCDRYSTINGPDCSDTDTNNWSSCTTCLDTDNDSWYAGCDRYSTIIGPDCNNTNAFTWDTCATCVDADSDTWYYNCNRFTYLGGDTVKQDGTGTSAWTPLLRTTSWDARSQAIYLASELGGNPGAITALSIYVVVAPGQVMNNFTIRVKHTSLSAYSTNSWEGPSSGWTTVYQANEPVGTTGWRTFTFSAPFFYNGTSNLMVDYSFHNTSAAGSNGAVYSTAVAGTRVIYYFVNGSAGDPLTWTGTTPTANAAAVIPNIRVTFDRSINGPDCLDSDNHTWNTCATCVDSDADGWRGVCNSYSGINGPDCLDSDAHTWNTCATCVDTDADGWRGVCNSYSGINDGSNPDCNDANINTWNTCATCLDTDADTWYDGCNQYVTINGTDCLNTDAHTWDTCATCVDGDGDTWRGVCNSYSGINDGSNPDCNDGNARTWNTCATCVDADNDTYYLLCNNYTGINGPDCSDTDTNNWSSCSTCLDTDSDTWFAGCDRYSTINGPDCLNTDNHTWDTCATCVDGDDDGWRGECNSYTGINGPDCSDTDTNNWSSCSTCLDTDDDTWYAGCDRYSTISGPDCNNTNNNTWNTCATCVDADNDTYYNLCNNYNGINGPDCSDTDTNNWNLCGACMDSDDDDWYAGCDRYSTISGPDCSDVNVNAWNTCATCLDNDIDGYYTGCNQYVTVTGPDCNDANAFTWDTCATCIDGDGDTWYQECNRYTYLGGDTVKQDGTGTSAWTPLLRTTSYDARSQAIYLASELGGNPGAITALSIYVVVAPGQVMNNFTIRVKHTSLSAYSTNSWEGPSSGWTTVYQANEPVGTTGWRTFTFSAPFFYNGTSNLMVDYSFHNTSAAGSNGAVYSTAVAGTRVIYYFVNGSAGDPLTWTGTTPAANAASSIPNIRVTFDRSINGPDCDDDDIGVWSDCASCVDLDGDGWYLLCNNWAGKNGPDCNDADNHTWNTCATCVDTDADGWRGVCNSYTGINDGVNPDCNDANARTWNTCATCVDTDGDTWFGTCNNYTGINDGVNPDCNNDDNHTWNTCATCVDNDTDGWRGVCNSYSGINDGVNPDCNEADTNNWNACGTCVDADGDTWYVNCNRFLTINGPDCQDTNKNRWDTCATCVDADGDTWYAGCNQYIGINGPDCNDDNNHTWDTCATCVDTDSDTWFGTCNNYTGINGPDCNNSDNHTWNTCATCVDADADGWRGVCNSYTGINDGANPDCNDGNARTWNTCATCVDTDGDTWFGTCNNYTGINGPDCLNTDNHTWDTCATCVDSDADTWRGVCNSYTGINDGVNPDCNDANTNVWNMCGTCVDADLDTWFVGCNRYSTISGPDCSDANTNNWSSCLTCLDTDGDTWYLGCDRYSTISGPDCNNTNNNTWDTCATCIDNDVDGWHGTCNAYNAISGPDCNDANAFTWDTCATCADADADTWYGNCNRFTYLGGDTVKAVTSGTSSWTPLLRTTSHDSRVQSIFLSSEIGGTGAITSLSVYVVIVPGQALNNFTIRLKHTSLSAFLPYTWEGPTSGWTTVYQANEPVGTIGWRTFTFSAPFFYNSASNLMVDISFNNSSSAATNGAIYSTSVSGIRTIYAFVNSTNGDPLNWTGSVPTTTPASIVPSIRLAFDRSINGPDCLDSDNHTWNTCATCVDADLDDWRGECNSYTGINGPDCNDANTNVWNMCGTCLDTDLDTWYVGCNRYSTISGPDCSDTDTNNWSSCATCLDTDVDTWYAGCDRYSTISGPDCNNANTNVWDLCGTCADADADAWYVGCNRYSTISGPDCLDSDNHTWNTCATCVDGDGDGWRGVCNNYTGINDGVNPDCSDTDTNNWTMCATCVDTDTDTWYAGCDRYSTISGPDCSNTQSTVFPGAPELCDGFDNQCTGDPGYGTIDEGCATDADNDGLTSTEETALGTDPNKWDTDGDGLSDKVEADNMSGHPVGENLDPLNAADGALDFDGEGISNADDYWNGTSIWSSDLTGYAECGYWAESDGDGFVTGNDSDMITSASIGNPTDYSNVFPGTGETQDMDNDGWYTGNDIDLINAMMVGAPTPFIQSRPAALEAVDTCLAHVAVGDTCHVSVGVLNSMDPASRQAGIAVVFTVDPSSTGTATIFGGEGMELGRYDLSESIYGPTPGVSRAVVRIDTAGTIKISARVPTCGVDPGIGRSSPEILLERFATITSP